MIYNILNGDALAFSFPYEEIEGETIVMREALIDGNLSGDNFTDFFHTRANYLQITREEYNNAVVMELKKILNAGDNAEFNLWFEYDLFCQVNMWFLISLIHNLPIRKKVFAVYTTYLDKSSNQFWNGFGMANKKELIICANNKLELTGMDLAFGQDLWLHYKNNNLDELSRQSKIAPAAFPYLEEVIKAHIDRFPNDGGMGRPEKVITEITQNVSKDFDTVFREFWRRENIYGFGDTQLRKIYDRVIK